MLFAAVGVVLWRGAFGLLPFERELVWRVPVSYSQVRKLEVQVWRDSELLKREERAAPFGLSAEPTSTLALTRGAHRAVMFVWLDGAPAPLSYTVDFDPSDDSIVVVAASDAPAGQKPPVPAPRQ